MNVVAMCLPRSIVYVTVVYVCDDRGGMMPLAFVADVNDLNGLRRGSEVLAAVADISLCPRRSHGEMKFANLLC